jgi:multidrug efflux pump subunit AcrB
MQVNFSVADVADIQRQLERALRESRLATLDDAERTKIVRLRLKSDVPRNNCRVDRLEVTGPEGFMMGFNQYKAGTCTEKKAHMAR